MVYAITCIFIGLLMVNVGGFTHEDPAFWIVLAILVACRIMGAEKE